MQTLAVFPGTFDPLTLGHLDIIKRASKIFDKVIIAVAKSPSKHTLFDLDTRVLLCRESTKDLSNVSVTGFSGMLVDFLKEKNANILFSTTNYHVFRSGMFSAKAGMKADGIGAKTKWYFCLLQVLTAVVTNKLSGITLSNTVLKNAFHCILQMILLVMNL